MRVHGPGGIWRSFVGLAEIADIAKDSRLRQTAANCGGQWQIVVENRWACARCHGGVP